MIDFPEMRNVLTFKIALEKYIHILMIKDLSPTTIAHRRRHLKHLETFMQEQGLSDVRAITEKTISDFVQSTAHKSWSSTTRFDVLVSIQNFFNRLSLNDLLFINPVPQKLPLKNPPPKLKQIWTLKEINKLLRAPFDRYPAGLRDKAMIELMYSSGIRLSELRRLEITDIHFNDGLAFINQGKGKKDRVVPVGKHALRAIQIYLSDLRPRLEKVKTTLLFINKVGRLMDINMLGAILNRYAARCGIKKRIHPHLLRHCMASHCLEAGASLSIVQNLLGHASAETTQIYTHIRPSELKRCHDRFHALNRNPLLKKLYDRVVIHNSGGKI